MANVWARIDPVAGQTDVKFGVEPRFGNGRLLAFGATRVRDPLIDQVGAIRRVGGAEGGLWRLGPVVSQWNRQIVPFGSPAGMTLGHEEPNYGLGLSQYLRTHRLVVAVIAYSREAIVATSLKFEDVFPGLRRYSASGRNIPGVSRS